VLTNTGQVGSSTANKLSHQLLLALTVSYAEPFALWEIHQLRNPDSLQGSPSRRQASQSAWCVGFLDSYSIIHVVTDEAHESLACDDDSALCDPHL
jgi:hypothetical protein